MYVYPDTANCESAVVNDPFGKKLMVLPVFPFADITACEFALIGESADTLITAAWLIGM